MKPVNVLVLGEPSAAKDLELPSARPGEQKFSVSPDGPPGALGLHIRPTSYLFYGFGKLLNLLEPQIFSLSNGNYNSAYFRDCEGCQDSDWLCVPSTLSFISSAYGSSHCLRRLGPRSGRNLRGAILSCILLLA